MRQNIIFSLSFALACFAFLLVSPLLKAEQPLQDPPHAVILTYHRFGDPEHASTQISMVLFRAQLTYLQRTGHVFVSVAAILEAFEQKTALPEKAVALTIDDAFRSFATKAWPLLRAKGVPALLFVATKPLEDGAPDYVSWEDLARLQAEGLSLGLHSHSHGHWPQASLAENQRDLRQAQALFQEKLGMVPDVFAFPFGEAGEKEMTLIRKAGFRAAFGQHSGVANAQDNRFFLPRFPMNDRYGKLSRFRQVVTATPLLWQQLQPAPGWVPKNPLHVRFMMPQGLKAIESLACFASGQGKIPLQRAKTPQGWLISGTVPQAFPSGRARLNCTLPRGDGRYRWGGMQYLVP